MSLTKENIVFIDTYLKNSGIEFLDLRMEMIDHVASEIEARMLLENSSFYESFKSYMIVNKSQLLKTNKKFRWTTDKKIVYKLGMELLKPRSLCIFALALVSLKALSLYIDFLLVSKFLPAGLFLFLLICYCVVNPKTKERYSGLERLGIIFWVFSQLLFHIFQHNRINSQGFFIQTINYNIIFNAFLILITAAFIRTAFLLRKEYQKNYQLIK